MVTTKSHTPLHSGRVPRRLPPMMVIGILSATLVGCANLTSLWTQTFSPKSSAPAVESATKTAQLPRPTPYPALYIPGQPEPLADMPKKLADVPKKQETVVPVVQFQEIAAKERPTSTDPSTVLRDLYRRAAEKNANLKTYVMRIKRREVIGTAQKPEEIMECRFRKEPWSVYFKWVGTEGKGREVVYVKDQHENKIHTLLAAGDTPFLPAGKRFSIAVDSILVRSKSRYPITDAGFGPMIERFGQVVQAVEKGDTSKGTLEYVGLVKRPEFPKEVAEVRHKVPPQIDPTLPHGGQRCLFFDPVVHLPTLVIAHDETGREVEYYCHDRFWFDYPMSDDDFNPDRLWPGAK